MVFFDRGSVAITKRGSQIIKEFAAVLKDTEDFRAEVLGHTDAAEAKTAAQTLSQQRATAVWSAILDENALNGLVTPYSFGASRPLVQTEPGVAEPQNRRVELTIRGGQMGRAARQECRAWLRGHCFTPSGLQPAGVKACNAVLDAI